MTFLNTIIVFILLLLLSIGLHELGHYIWFRKAGVKPRIRVLRWIKTRKVYVKWLKKEITLLDVKFEIEMGEWKDYNGLNIKQLMNIYSYAIFFGIVPIIISFFFFGKIMIMALILYYNGCRKDMKSLYNLAMAHKKDLMEEAKQ